MEQLNDVYLALLLSEGTYTMDNPEAVEVALAINPGALFPCTGGTRTHVFQTTPQIIYKVHF